MRIMRLHFVLILFCCVINNYQYGVNAYVAPVCGEKGVVCQQKMIHVYGKCDKASCQGFKICRLIHTLRNIFLKAYIYALEQIFESISDDKEGGPHCKGDDLTLLQRTISYWIGDNQQPKAFKKPSTTYSSFKSKTAKKKSFQGLYYLMVGVNYLAMIFSLYSLIGSYYGRVLSRIMPTQLIELVEQIKCEVMYWKSQILQFLRLESRLEDDDEDCYCNHRHTESSVGISYKLTTFFKNLFATSSSSNTNDDFEDHSD